MPYSAEIFSFYWDFGNGFIPFFSVIGAYNILMYSDNDVQPAINMVPDAIASFDEIGVINPIPDQSMYYGDVLTFDVSNLFAHPTGEPITVSLQNNSNPSVVNADVTNDVLTLTALNVSGNSTISLLGVGGTLNCTYDFEVSVVDPTDQYVVILDLDPTSTGDVLKTSIENFYQAGEVNVTNDIAAYPLLNADAVFVLLGIFSNNYVLTETEAGPLASYLDGGGNVYMEGGDTWYYDGQTSVHPYFNIAGLSDGSPDLSAVDGHDFLNGMNWTYTGENSWIDRLTSITPAVTIFSNPTVGYDCGVAYDSGTYKTVGTSFEITGLDGTNSLDDAVGGIIDFFDIGGAPLSPPTNLAVDEITGLFTWDAPAIDELTGYDVYLDGNLQGNTTDLEWQFTDLINGTTYEAGVEAVYDEGVSDLVTIDFTYNGTSAGNNLVTVTELKGNYPNPFNPSTTIAFSISIPGHVTLEVFNIKGEKVKILVDGVLDVNNHTVTWNGTDNAGKSVASGVYFYKLISDGNSGRYTSTKKMILLK